jgi:hypothetical protein
MKISTVCAAVAMGIAPLGRLTFGEVPSMRFMLALLYMLATRGLLVALGFLAVLAFASGSGGLTAPVWWGLAVCSVGLMDETL